MSPALFAPRPFPRFTRAVALALCMLTAGGDVKAQAPVSIRTSGDGPETYVLLTGVIGGVFGFRQVEARLAQLGKRVIVIDPYLLSIDSTDVSFDAMARRVNSQLVSRGVSSAKIVGHAHGGGVALRLVANNPAIATELFLLNVGAIADNRNPVFSASMRIVPFITRLPMGREFVRRKIVAGIRENTAHSEWLDERTAIAYTDPMLDNIGRVVGMGQRLVKAAEPEPLEAVISRVHVPVTLLIGAVQCSASPGPAELAALQPLGDNVTTYRIANACHFPHEEALEEVMTDLLRTRVARSAISPTAAPRE